ncbi:unnamed protein product [Ectocarpus fasciculatus]
MIASHIGFVRIRADASCTRSSNERSSSLMSELCSSKRSWPCELLTVASRMHCRVSLTSTASSPLVASMMAGIGTPSRTIDRWKPLLDMATNILPSRV